MLQLAFYVHSTCQGCLPLSGQPICLVFLYCASIVLYVWYHTPPPPSHYLYPPTVTSVFWWLLLDPTTFMILRWIFPYTAWQLIAWGHHCLVCWHSRQRRFCRYQLSENFLASRMFSQVLRMSILVWYLSPIPYFNHLPWNFWCRRDKKSQGGLPVT